MKKILFPTDFSESSLKVLSYTAKFCKKLNAELLLFNAMLAPVIQSDGPIIGTEDIIEEQEKGILNRLNELASELRNNYNIVVSAEAKYGFSAETIAEAAKEFKANMIILSAKGESNIFDKIFGNVTLDLFKTATVPVLSLPEKAEFDDIKKIAFASSNIDYDAVEIFDLIRLTEPFKPEIKLVHVKRGNDFEKETFEEFNNLEYVEIPEEEDKIESLLNYLGKNEINLVCVKRYKLPVFYRIFHKSFTEDLFYHSKTPLLVFQDES